jgi:pilus assembly protein Flp/PilA
MLTRLVVLRSRFNSDKGATAVEYVLMVTMIAVVIIVAVTALGVSVNSLFQAAATSV